MILQIIFCFIAGFMASVGFGGGFFFLIYLTSNNGIAQMEAQAINLFFFILVAAISVIFSISKKLINFKTLVCVVLYGLIGVMLGILLEFALPVFIIRKIFAAFLFIIGLVDILKLLKLRKKYKKKTVQN